MLWGIPESIYLHRTYKYVILMWFVQKKFPNPALLVPIEPKIHVGKEVLKIQWDDVKGGPATVLCSDGSKYCADKVLITVSLGVLKKYHLDLFEPNLPENKQVAIKVNLVRVRAFVCFFLQLTNIFKEVQM